MIEFIIYDEKLTVAEIEKFIDDNDIHGVFKTRHRWHDNFEKHFHKLLEVRQIVTFRKDGELIGLCSWMVVDEDRKREINKATWGMPENVIDGDILYIDVCILKDPASIFKIKEFLNGEYKLAAKEVFWFNIPHGRVFRNKFKGGIPCQTVD